MSEVNPKIVELNQRRLARISDKWEHRVPLDEGEICFLIRMAELVLTDLGRTALNRETDQGERRGEG